MDSEKQALAGLSKVLNSGKLFPSDCKRRRSAGDSQREEDAQLATGISGKPLKTKQSALNCILTAVERSPRKLRGRDGKRNQSQQREI
jgi:hypothetical protein